MGDKENSGTVTLQELSDEHMATAIFRWIQQVKKNKKISTRAWCIKAGVPQANIAQMESSYKQFGPKMTSPEGKTRGFIPKYIVVCKMAYALDVPIPIPNIAGSGDVEIKKYSVSPADFFTLEGEYQEYKKNTK